jgi:hypothetical protein
MVDFLDNRFPRFRARRYNIASAYPAIGGPPVHGGACAGWLIPGGGHVSFNTYTPPGWWDRTRMLRYTFVAGLLVGVMAGWFFHGLISMAVRFGVVVVLLIPIALLVFMWWRSSRERNRLQTTMTVMRWTGGQFPPYGGDAKAGQYGNIGFEPGDVVDLNDIRTREQPR